MKSHKPFLLIVVVFLIMSFPIHYLGGEPSSSASDDMAGEITILKPGSSITCDKDFIIENLSDGETELQVTLGNSPYISEKILANEKLAYNLNATRALARAHGKDVAMDDIATIFNKGENAQLKLRRYSLRRNPLRVEDELKIFK